MKYLRIVFPTTQKEIGIIRCFSISGIREMKVPDTFFENEIVQNLIKQIKLYIDFRQENNQTEKRYIRVRFMC